MKTTPPIIPIIPAAMLRELSCRASCDPRTIRRYLRGEPISQLPRQRIEVALRAEGYGHLVRDPENRADPSSTTPPSAA